MMELGTASVANDLTDGYDDNSIKTENEKTKNNRNEKWTYPKIVTIYATQANTAKQNITMLRTDESARREQGSSESVDSSDEDEAPIIEGRHNKAGEDQRNQRRNHY